MNKKWLTDFELREIKEKITAVAKDIDSENISIRDEDDDDMDEGSGSVSCTDVDTTEARTRNFDQRESVNHIGSKDELQLVGKVNHNMSSDTTYNNTIMSYASVMENSKTNRNPKYGKVIKLEKKTIMLNILLLESKLLKPLNKLKLLVWVNVKT